jgi:DNA-binding NtrC family response regulator
MDLDAQGQLAGSLDTGVFLRVGGTEPVQVDVRVIACTHKDLQGEVAAGRFREDLFYQLNVVPLDVPPLREHREDVPELLKHFVEQFVAQEKLPYRHFTLGAQNFLRNYGWPGNIRELKNLVQRLLILGAGPEITQEEVETTVGSAPHAAAGMQIPGLSMDQPLRQARESFERVYLEYQLEKHGGNVTKMAQEVGMERTHLYRKLRSVGIEIREHR